MRQLGRYERPAESVREILFNEWVAPYKLTNCERAVALELITGATSKEIAQSLDLSYHTVNDYTKRLFTKLGIRDRYKVMGLFINSILTQQLDKAD